MKNRSKIPQPPVSRDNPGAAPIATIEDRLRDAMARGAGAGWNRLKDSERVGSVGQDGCDVDSVLGLAVGNPELERLLEEESALNALLDRRTAPKTSSNFTRQVLDQTRKLELAGDRVGRSVQNKSLSWYNRFRSLLTAMHPAWRHSGVAWTGLTAMLLVFGGAWWLYNPLPPADPWTQMAYEITQATSGSGIGMDALANFDAIHRMNALARPEDDALVAALMQ